MPIAPRTRLPNPWRGLRGLPADVWIVFATSLVNRAGMMALPFLVLYLTEYLHVSARIAGFAISAYGIGGMIAAPIAGRWSDRVGAFTVMRTSLVLTGVVLLLIPLAHGLVVVGALTFVWGFAADSVRPATMTALTNATPAEQRKAAIAVNRLAVNLGMSIGPAIGGFLALVSFPSLFVVDGGTSLAAVVLWTIGEMITFPVGGAQMADLAPAGRSGEYMGAYSSVFSLAMVVGPWAGTAALDRFGPRITWTGVLACGLLAAAVIGATAEHRPDDDISDSVSDSTTRMRIEPTGVAAE